MAPDPERNHRMAALSPRWSLRFCAACARSVKISAGALSGQPQRGCKLGHSWAAQHRLRVDLQAAGPTYHSDYETQCLHTDLVDDEMLPWKALSRAFEPGMPPGSGFGC